MPDGLDRYDVVFLGYSIWWGEAPRIISTFLERGDFKGKTIVPFCTSHSSGLGSSDRNLHSLARMLSGYPDDALQETPPKQSLKSGFQDLI